MKEAIFLWVSWELQVPKEPRKCWPYKTLEEKRCNEPWGPSGTSATNATRGRFVSSGLGFTQYVALIPSYFIHFLHLMGHMATDFLSFASTVSRERMPFSSLQYQVQSLLCFNAWGWWLTWISGSESQKSHGIGPAELTNPSLYESAVVRWVGSVVTWSCPFSLVDGAGQLAEGGHVLGRRAVDFDCKHRIISSINEAASPFLFVTALWKTLILLIYTEFYALLFVFLGLIKSVRKW